MTEKVRFLKHNGIFRQSTIEVVKRFFRGNFLTFFVSKRKDFPEKKPFYNFYCTRRSVFVIVSVSSATFSVLIYGCKARSVPNQFCRLPFLFDRDHSRTEIGTVAYAKRQVTVTTLLRCG